jgi:hypothetical protein
MTRPAQSARSAFRSVAVIDWLDITITLAQPTQFQWIQSSLRRILNTPESERATRVTPVNPDPGGSCLRFTIRLHDQHANSFKELARIMAELSNAFPFASPPTVTAIELALDTYCKGGTLRQLADIAASRFKFSTRTPFDHWHFYRMKGEGRQRTATMDRREIARYFEAGWNLTDRTDKSEDADNRAHDYVKTTDKGGKVTLPLEEHRARSERTLRGDHFHYTLASLERFDFTSLAHHFKFRKLADDLHPAVRHALTWSGQQFGKSGNYRRPSAIIGRYRNTSKFRQSTVADDVLNADAYNALRALTRRWTSAKK